MAGYDPGMSDEEFEQFMASASAQPLPPKEDVEPAPVVQEEVTPQEVTETPVVQEDQAPTEPVDSVAVEETPAVSETPAEIDYKAFYENVTSEFKASGRTVKFDKPEEIIALMQKGVDYSGKSRELSQQRKFVHMLDSNGLLDEQKLAFLIDLEKKNPEAIKKFVKESGFDPLTLVGDEEPVSYTPQTRMASDIDIAFEDAIADVLKTETGQATIETISGWDDASRQAVIREPDTIKLINAHKQNGVYDTIANEIERRLLVGSIPQNTPFINAYVAVGNELQARQAPANVVAQPAPAPVAIRVATPTPDPNAGRVAAISAPKATKAVNNRADPYMSDEELQRFMQTRY